MLAGKRKLEDRDAVVEGQDYARKALRLAPPGPRDDGDSAVYPRAWQNVEALNPGFASLLVFSTLNATEEIYERFRAIARELLCHTILSVVHNGTRTDFDILEVELYLHKAHCHEDPFTHMSVEQEHSGQWYFHRSPRRPPMSTPGLMATAGGYRGGTRKGLDLTMGGPARAQTSANAPVTTRGGILLRTVRRRTDNQVICGPSLLVDEILRLSNASSLHQLVNTAWNGDISALSQQTPARGTYMCLKRAMSPGESPTVYCSPRIGLDLSNPDTSESITHPRVVYVGKPYRFFIHPELLAKGRVQTFVGLYNMLQESRGYAAESMELKKALRDTSQLGEQIVSKYMADYISGYRIGRLKSFIGPSKKGLCQSPSEYLKMMGALHKALQQFVDP